VARQILALRADAVPHLFEIAEMDLSSDEWSCGDLDHALPPEPAEHTDAEHRFLRQSACKSTQEVKTVQSSRFEAAQKNAPPPVLATRIIVPERLRTACALCGKCWGITAVTDLNALTAPSSAGTGAAVFILFAPIRARWPIALPSCHIAPEVALGRSPRRRTIRVAITAKVTR
jgi:hypothetical protein